MQGKLTIDKLSVHAFHGCMDEESVVGTQFTVSAEIHYDLAAAALSDDLEQAVDYGAISELMKRELQQRNNLIETVALRILNKVKALDPKIEFVKIHLVKHAPPINANVQSVSVHIEG